MIDYWLVIPAAGSGRRFGGAPKQHAALAGATVLQWALRPFLADARCRGGAVVMAADDAQRRALRSRLPTRFDIVDGGAERVHSVLQGLAALAAPADDWVLVHDAARPCLSAADLERLLLAAGASSGGGLLAVPTSDTVKLAAQLDADAPRVSVTTLARDTLWLAQTPQMFRYGALRAALLAALAAGRVPTDEAQAMEWSGVQPLLVEAREGNPKVTTATDLVLAEALLQTRAVPDAPGARERQAW
jgi:2-C-methyl-D-erythritol 4-phosphate cytidylyltransferase